MDGRNIEGYVSENIWCEDGEVIISETKFKNEYGNEEEDNDWFLKGFLEGYRSEKNRRHRLKMEQEERVKKEQERRKEEIEILKSRIRTVEIEGKEKQNSLMRTIESLKVTGKQKQDSLIRTIESLKVTEGRLIMEKLELKEELEKERLAKQKVVKNWKKTKQEIIKEYEKDAAVYGAMTGSVKEVKADSAYQDGSKEEGGEIWRKVEE